MLVWERPLALWLLGLLLIVLLRSLQRGVPAGRLLGTLRFWPAREVVGDEHERQVPPARWALLAAMGSAVLGLAGPVWQQASPRPVWRVIVDRSPSMALATESGGSRWGRALEALDAALDAQVARVFVAGDTPELQHEGQRPPEGWASLTSRPEPDWPRFDRAQTVWLTDRLPTQPPVHACVVAGGGDLVPGVVARDSEWELVFDGEAEILRAATGGPLGVEVRAPASSQLAALARLWAENRGHRLTSESPALLVDFVGAQADGAEESQRVARDGWSLHGSVAPSAVGQPWVLAQPSGWPAVSWQPGRVDVFLLEEGLPQGDLAGLAQAFGDLLDRAVAPGPQTISSAERAGAGAGGVLGTFDDLRGEESNSNQRLLKALFAGLAGCLGLLALALSRKGRL